MRLKRVQFSYLHAAAWFLIGAFASWLVSAAPVTPEASWNVSLYTVEFCDPGCPLHVQTPCSAQTPCSVQTPCFVEGPLPESQGTDLELSTSRHRHDGLPFSDEFLDEIEGLLADEAGSAAETESPLGANCLRLPADVGPGCALAVTPGGSVIVLDLAGFR